MNLCFSVLGRTELCPIFSVNYVERRVPLKAFALCMPFCGDRQGLVFLHELWPFHRDEEEVFTEWAVSPHHRIRPIWSIFRVFTSHFILFIFNFPSFSPSHFVPSSLSDEAAFFTYEAELYFLFCCFDQHAVMTQFTPSKTMTQIWSCHTCVSHKFHVSINHLSIFILGSATHQSDFSAVVMIHLMAHLNGRQRRYIVDSYNCQYNRHYHPINLCISDLYIFHLLWTMVQRFQSWQLGFLNRNWTFIMHIYIVLDIKNLSPNKCI